MKVDSYMTVTEAAARLGVTRQRVLALIGAKKLRSQMIGNYYLLNKVDVEKRLASRMQEANVLLIFV